MNFLEYIKPELLALIPVLFFIGKTISGFKIDSTWIPVILGVCGIALSTLWVLATAKEYSNVPMAVFTAIVQGILCAGAAVYGDQIIKQTTKRKQKRKQSKKT